MSRRKQKQEAADIEPVSMEAMQTEEYPTAEEEQTLTEELKKDNIEEDDPCSVKLTILILSEEPSGEYLRYCIRSLSNLRGIDADVKVTGRNKPTWLKHEDFISVAEDGDSQAQIILKALNLIKTERVILLTDRMFIVNPVSMADIALLKALPESADEKVTKLLKQDYQLEKPVVNFNTNTPLYVFRSQLIAILYYAIDKISGADIPTVYCNKIYQDIKPLYLNWRRDPWVLPVVSAKPNPKVVADYAKDKKFMYMISCNPHLLEILATMYPIPSAAEDANPE